MRIFFRTFVPDFAKVNRKQRYVGIIETGIECRDNKQNIY